MILLWLGCVEEKGWTPEELKLIQSLSPLPPLPQSPTNRWTDDPQAAALGKQLFEDKGLSDTGEIACSSCHQQELAFTDGNIAATTHHGTGSRNVPTILGTPWNTWFFWDGRADSMWAQATGPLTNPIEHALTPEGVKARIEEAWEEPFIAVFGEISSDPLRVVANVGKAIEAFERTLSPGESRFDRYVAALPTGQGILTPQEETGLKFFIGSAGCISCHNGPLLTDHSFHNLAIPLVPGVGHDAGRARGALEVLTAPYRCGGDYSDPDPHDPPCAELRYLDPNFPDWPAAFKTPSLRNVAKTAPYMHDGSMKSLTEVLLFYNALPGSAVVGHRELTLQPLRFSEGELASLEAFLGTLSGEY
jgi:cytochrome c peroxidase